jgi:hypothetical protein
MCATDAHRDRLNRLEKHESRLLSASIAALVRTLQNSTTGAVHCSNLIEVEVK